MSVAEDTTPKRLLGVEWRGIPPIMRVLYVTNRQRTGGWLVEALSADRVCDLRIEEVVGSAAGLAQLRDDSFDAVLVTHDPNELDALKLIEGYRAGGAYEPIVVLGIQSEQELGTPCYEAGADAYVCANTTTTRSLVWIVAQAVQRHQLIRENRRLTLADEQRLQREHDEAEQLLWQQRALIADLEYVVQRGKPRAAGQQADGEHCQVHFTRVSAVSNGAPAATLPPNLPNELVDHYRELLRAYVIMGSGNLTKELNWLARLLITAGITARQTMQLHVHVLEELVSGLGSRSTRHVMTRADLLVLEIMVHLAEGYRTRYRERICPPAQLTLPGFENSVPVSL